MNSNTANPEIIGKAISVIRKMSADEKMLYDIQLREKAILDERSALNFAKRRPDLFRDFEDMNIPNDKLVKRKARYKSMKYYYVKIWQSDDRNGTYLGYFIASDEYSEYIKAKDVKEEPIWI